MASAYIENELEKLAKDFSKENYMIALADNYRRAIDLPKAIKGIHFSRYLNWKTDAKHDYQYAMSKTKINIQSLEKEVKVQRALGVSGHWSYDHNRHKLLVKCLYGEKAILSELLSWKEAA